MSGLGPIVRDFGGEQRTFLVLVGELELIQAKCKAGPGEVAHRLARPVQLLQSFEGQKTRPSIVELAALGLGPLYPDDIRAPILYGLIAGGLAPNAAGALVRQWIDARGFLGLIENVDLAFELVVAGYSAPTDPDEDPGAGEPGREATASPPAA